ncbi:T9SS C-terminal target domain-containing protein [Sphingobacteriales bacterium UPWRP_1]|nr:hypothetical protein BVG80_15185 [Sphingobacteriales bacterium TSM_CSM]PSJ79093.1 T9SS C-terminal target domain-containing protein [Sphingobacteriales bacterium UPWRP_1]
MKTVSKFTQKALMVLALMLGLLFTTGTHETARAQSDSTLVAVDDYVFANSAFLTIDVLSNDYSDSGLLIAGIGCGPSYGVAEVSPAGGITYYYNMGAILDDQFCYVVCNSNSVCDTAMVYIVTDSIAPPPGPVAYNDYVQLMSGTTAVFSPLSNDVTSGIVTITATSMPMNGTLIASGTTFSYTPNPGFSGEDLFTYTICNALGNCSSATVYLFVEDIIPGGYTIANNDVATTTEGEPVIIDILGNDTWDPALVLTIVSITNPANGTVTPGDVAVYYTPNPGFTGVDYFSYYICTGNTPEYCDSAMVTIYVMPSDSDTTIVTPCLWGCVWPGDADNNGIANNYDVLAIGLGYDLTGPTRTDASLNWVGQYADDWSNYLGSWPDSLGGGTTIGYFNAKYADCNGNGTINAEDTLAVSVNYGLTHGKTGADADEDAPMLYFNLPPVVEEDSWVSADVMLGEAGTMVSNIHGIAFTFNFDTTMVDPASVSFSYDAGSWLGSAGNLSFAKTLPGGLTDAAYTRTDQTDVSGYGKIGTVHFFVIDNIDGKNQSGEAPLLQIWASDAATVNAAGQLVQLNTQTASADIATGLAPNTPAGTNALTLYPNPANDWFTVFTNTATAAQITLFNLQGQPVYTTTAAGNSATTINTRHFTPGMYLLQAKTEGTVTTRKVQIVR